MPRITVLMTVYNGSKYLRLSLEAVLNQTLRDFEFLIINDCSTDDSLEIIRSYNDPRIVVQTNEKNLGQTRSLNVGLEKAQAKYIARMDADDLAYPRWLEEQYKYITSHDVSVVTTKAAVIDTQGRLKRILNSPDTFEEMLLESMFASPVNHVGSLFGKQDAVSVGGYNEDMVISADFGLWSKMLHRGFRFATTPEILIAIRFHDQSASAMRVDKEMKESSWLMGQNVAWLTGLALSAEDTLLWWQWVYRTASLNEEQFAHVLKTVNKAYESIKKEFSISPKVIQRVRVTQSKVVFVKKIFGCIKDNKTKEIVRLCEAYKIYAGHDPLFVLIAMLAGLGNGVLKILPFAYEKIALWKAWGRTRLCF